MKKIFSVLILFSIVSLSLYASDGFGLIFDDSVSLDESISHTSDVSGNISIGFDSYIGETDFFESEMNPFAHLHLSLTYSHPSLEGNAEITLPAIKEGSISYQDILKEISLSYYLPIGKIQVGYFIHQWGVLDTARAVDIINADDYSSGLRIHQREMKVSEPMLLSQLFFNNSNLEIIYKPVFTPIQMDLSGRWNTLPDMSGYFTILPDATMTTPDTNTLGYGSIGIRYAMPIGSLDAAFIYYRGYYQNPSYRYTIVSSGPPYEVSDIETIYTKMNIIGSQMSYVIHSFTLCGEGAFYISEDIHETDPNLYNSKLVYTSSLSYMIPNTSSYITSSYRGSSILGYQEGNPLDVDTASLEQDHTIIIGFHIPLLQERLLIEGGLTYQIPTKGYAILSKVDYSLKDDITLTLEGKLFGTFDEDLSSIYNQWAHNDSVSLSLTYQY